MRERNERPNKKSPILSQDRAALFQKSIGLFERIKGGKDLGLDLVHFTDTVDSDVFGGGCSACAFPFFIVIDQGFCLVVVNFQSFLHGTPKALLMPQPTMVALDDEFQSPEYLRGKKLCVERVIVDPFQSVGFWILPYGTPVA